jgi:hypothetical protein
LNANFSARFALRGAVALCSRGAFQALAVQNSTTRLTDEFRQAERLYWLDNWVKARPLYADCEQGFAVSDPAKALICKFSRLRAEAETDLSYYTVSKIISRDLETETARTHPEVRVRGLIVKATADLSIHDPVLSGQEWEQVEELAHSLKENGWEGRAKGELGIVAYLRGDTAKAVALNTESFETAKELHDVAGMIRAFSLKGVGLLERDAADQSLRCSVTVRLFLGIVVPRRGLLVAGIVPLFILRRSCPGSKRALLRYRNFARLLPDP